MTDRSRQAGLFWNVALGVIVLDAATKYFATRDLQQSYAIPVVGDVVRFTLVFNPGAAFSMTLGPYQRYIFGGLALVALVILWKLAHDSGPSERLRVFALALAWGGAAGNLVDRIVRYAVVDFIDVGYGGTRFWTFNIADSAVTIGAILLAISLWRDDVRHTSDQPQTNEPVLPVAE